MVNKKLFFLLILVSSPCYSNAYFPGGAAGLFGVLISHYLFNLILPILNLILLFIFKKKLPEKYYKYSFRFFLVALIFPYTALIWGIIGIKFIGYLFFLLVDILFYAKIFFGFYNLFRIFKIAKNK